MFARLLLADKGLFIRDAEIRIVVFFCLVSSISEGLAILPHTRDRFLTKSGQFNGGLHARLHKNGWRSKIQKTDCLFQSLNTGWFNPYF